MNLNSAFKKATAASAGKSSSISGNILLQPTEFKEKTVVGKVLTGAGAGTEIEVAYGGRLTQKDYTDTRKRKLSTSSFVDIDAGGTLRVERVKAGEDGIYTSRWMRTMNGQPDENDKLFTDSVSKFVRYTRNGKPGMVINRLIQDDEATASTIDELKAAMAEKLDATGSAVFFAMVNGQASEALMRKSGETPNAETVDTFFNSLPEEIVASIGEAIAEKPASVFPIASHYITGTTLEAIETHLKEGNPDAITTVNPNNWKLPTIGMRLSRAVNLKGDDALPEGVADKLADAFKAYADKDEAAKFAKSGWKAVSNDTLTAFFASKGIELAEYDDTGWGTQSFVQGSIELDNGGTIDFVKKAFQTRPTSPFPAVSALEGALDGYYKEMSEAAKQLVDGLRVEAGAEAPKSAAKKEETAKTTTADALPDDGDGIDDLLGDLDGEMDFEGS
ncbi:hypothetical protein [Pseudosulfitobacter pseudonitzschiae]|uniref:hypothetical protein n=1 Tax=Pseudosulfitobacter pseudonitzschiae TaxID=1402135 RepID=UPI003B801D10